MEKVDSVFSCFLGDCYSSLQCEISRDKSVLGHLRAALGISWHVSNSKHSNCPNSLKLPLMHVWFTWMFDYLSQSEPLESVLVGKERKLIPQCFMFVCLFVAI